MSSAQNDEPTTAVPLSPAAGPARPELPGPGILAAVAWAAVPVAVLNLVPALSYVPGFESLSPPYGTMKLLSLVVSWAVVRWKLRGNVWRGLALRGFDPAHLVCLLTPAPALIVLDSGLRTVLWWFYEATGLFEPSSEMSTMTRAVLQVREDMTVTGVVVIAGLISLLPAVSEELYDRGFLGRGLLARAGPIGGIALTSILFGLQHMDPIQSVLAALFGALAHMAYLWSRSLLAPIVLHVMQNGVLLLAMLSPTDSRPWWLLRSFGHFTALHVIPALATVAALWWLYRAMRSEWILPDGTPWTPGYVTAEMPPAALGARLLRRRPSARQVLVPVVAYGALIGAIAWKPPILPIDLLEPKLGADVELPESASRDTPAGKLAALSAAGGQPSSPERRLLLAVEAWREAQSAGESWSPEVVQALADAVRSTDRAGEPTLIGARSDLFYMHPALSPDGRLAAATALFEQSTAFVWSVDGQGPEIVLRGHGADIEQIVFSPDSRHVVTASEDGTARVWSAGDRGEPVVLRGHESRVQAATFSPDGRRVVTASRDGTARIWNADGTGSPVVLRAQHGAFYSAAFSPDGGRIAVGDLNGSVRIWNADGTGRPIVLRPHRWAVDAVAFSPDGLRVVSASGEDTARIWSADGTGSPIVLRGHTKDVLSGSFSPDGDRIVTASADGTARVWSAHGQGGAIVLPTGQEFFWSARFTPDGEHVVTPHEQGQFHVWTVSGALLASRACALAGRNFTRREWRALFPARPYRKTCPDWPGGRR